MTQTGFQLSENDNKKFKEWNKEHRKGCKYFDNGSATGSPVGAIGGRLTYSFTPTSVGAITTVECACGEKLDLTDFENW